MNLGRSQKALLLAIVSTAFFTIMHSLVRYLSDSLHPFEISFFRGLFGLIAVMPLLLGVGTNVLKARNTGLLTLRGILTAISMLCWFYGLSLVPIADATALSFTNILFATVGASLFLGETMRLRRWSAVVLGFLGMLFIVRPGFAELNVGIVVVLCSAVIWGGNNVLVKKISRTDSTLTIVVWTASVLTLATVIPAISVWRWPSGTELLLLALIGTLGTIGHIAWTYALKTADATVIIPTDFTRLIWAVGIGFFFFAELPNHWTWLGSALIIGSTAYIGYREGQLARDRSPPASVDS